MSDELNAQYVMHKMFSSLSKKFFMYFSVAIFNSYKKGYAQGASLQAYRLVSNYIERDGTKINFELKGPILCLKHPEKH